MAPKKHIKKHFQKKKEKKHTAAQVRRYKAWLGPDRSDQRPLSELISSSDDDGSEYEVMKHLEDMPITPARSSKIMDEMPVMPPMDTELMAEMESKMLNKMMDVMMDDTVYKLKGKLQRGMESSSSSGSVPKKIKDENKLQR